MTVSLNVVIRSLIDAERYDYYQMLLICVSNQSDVSKMIAGYGNTKGLYGVWFVNTSTLVRCALILEVYKTKLRVLRSKSFAIRERKNDQIPVTGTKGMYSRDSTKY